MASGNALICYGDLVNRWSLYCAAWAHNSAEKQLLAIDLIILRLSKGQLQTESQKSGVRRFPIEIWSLIQDEICILALVNIRRLLMEKYIEAAESGGNAEYISAAQLSNLKAKKVGKTLMTSYDWESWSFIEQTCDDDWPHDWELNDPFDLLFQLGGRNNKLIPSFLAQFGLGTMDCWRADLGSERHPDFKGGAASFFSPIFNLGTSTSVSSDVDGNSPDRASTDVVEFSPDHLSNSRPSSAPFNLLFRRYQIEFTQPAPHFSRNINYSTSLLDHVGLVSGSGGKVKEESMLRRPNPRWIYWCQVQADFY